MDRDRRRVLKESGILKSKGASMIPKAVCVILGMLLVSSCGGGGGGSSPARPETDSTDWNRDVFSASVEFAGQCASPRSGIDPNTGNIYPDMSGSVLTENQWLRSWSNETYLWYDEIIDRDPALYSTPDYFALLKTDAITASGKPKDQFHFSIPTQEWIESTQAGSDLGYGAQWTLISTDVPREMIVAYTEPNSPATSPDVDLRRGAQVLEVDGVDFVNDESRSGVNTLNEAIFPTSAGQQHSFTVRDFGATSTRTVSMVSQQIISAPVQNVRSIATSSGNVGYIAFHSHNFVSERQLVEAVAELQEQGISDLVLDVRYNGGGAIAIASQMAYMVAGPAATADKAFVDIRYNDKTTVVDSDTGQPIEPIPFLSETLGLSLQPGQGLPALNLSRLFVITGNNTCSASENIINGLVGIDFEVILIGGTTCGKPYGSNPTDNCGTTYFPIQLQSFNDAGFGDYTDGFGPPQEAGGGVVVLNGCAVVDDFGHELGDSGEGRLRTALSYRDSGSCSVTASSSSKALLKSNKLQPGRIYDGQVPRSPWVPNEIR